MQDAFQIMRIEDPEQKAKIAWEVLLDLPDWFGIPEARDAYKTGNEIIGFITLTETSPETGEIHCMGVKQAYHRQGIGTQLYLELEKHAKEKYKYLQVKTVEEGHYAEYDQTVAFYRSVAFPNLRSFQPCGTGIIHVW